MSDSAIADVVIALLDAQHAASLVMEYVAPLALLPSPKEYELVKQTVLLWATAKGGKLEYVTSRRVCRIWIRHALFVTVHVPEQHEFDPTNVYSMPAWRPSRAVDGGAS